MDSRELAEKITKAISEVKNDYDCVDIIAEILEQEKV